MCFKTYTIFSKVHALWEGISQGILDCTGESNQSQGSLSERGRKLRGRKLRVSTGRCTLKLRVSIRKQKVGGMPGRGKSEGMQGTPRSWEKQVNRFSPQSLQNEPALMTSIDSDLDLWPLQYLMDEKFILF